MNRFTRMVTVAALGLGTTASFNASAETYYWAGEDFALFGEASNWKIGSASGTTATTCPGAADKLYGCQNRKLDLGGGEWTISGWNSTAEWTRYTTWLQNGTFQVAGTVTTYNGTMDLNTDAVYVLLPGSTYQPAVWDASAHEIKVRSGATFKAYGKYENYKTELSVRSGGVAVFDPNVFKFICGTAQASWFENQAGGTLDFPNGLVFGSSSDVGAGSLAIRQAGTMTLGGAFSRNGVGVDDSKFSFTISGGTVAASNTVTFTGMNCAITGSAEFNVLEDSVLNLSPFTLDSGLALTKSGVGKLVLPGTTVDELVVLDGQVLAATENMTIASITASEGATLDIVATGLTVGTVSGTPRVAVSGTFAVGDTLVTSDSAETLAIIQDGLLLTGVSSTIDGNQLKLAASELVFNSTTVTDLNDPAGWKGGAVPAAGTSVFVSGAGVVADITGEIPAFAQITVDEGATLRVSTDATLVPVMLATDGTVEVAQGTATANALAFSYDGTGAIGTLRVLAGAMLKVPGGKAFKNCALDLKGTVETIGDGKLVFGTADDGETAHFAMTAEGATITAKNAAGVENAARLEFAVPAAGGTVVVASPIVLKDSTLTYNEKDGIAFGLNNPNEQEFQIVADGTDVEIGSHAYVAGGANVVMTNGSVFLRKRHSEGDTSESKYNIYVQNRGRITLVAGGELRAGVTRVNGNETDGVISVNPDEAGWVGIDVREGGIAHWYKVNGQEKGTIRFADGVQEMYTSQWWSWNNRSHVYNKLAAVEIEDGKSLFFKGVSPKMPTGKSTLTTFEFEAPFTGGGDLVISNTRADTLMEPTLYRGDNTCTGRLVVGEDDDTARARLHIANGANWAGTVVLDGRIDLVPADGNHSSAANEPSVVSFKGVELNAPFTFRLWISQSGESFEVVNDVVNVGADGWTVNSTVTFESKSALNLGDLPVGTEFSLGTMPKGGAVPTSSHEKVRLYERAIDGDETTSELVGCVQAGVEFVFTGGAKGVTNLGDPSGWEGGAVPSGQDVIVRGEGVTALLNADQGLPEFESIALRGGATLAVVGKDASEADFTLPPLSLDATSALVIGDDNETATTVRLPDSFATAALVGEEDVSLTRLLVNKGATLVVPAGTKFKNVDIALYGTIGKDTTEGEGVCFGYAEKGETSYFAMTSDVGIIDVHSDQNMDYGRKWFLSPAEGGCVKAVGDIVLKDTWIKVNGWADFGEIRVGVNNPAEETFNFVLDGTAFGTTANTYFGGGARLVVKNGSYIDRDSACRGHWYPTYLQDAATIAVEGEGSYLDLNVGDGYLYMNSPVDGEVVVRDGGSYLCRYSKGNAQGTLVFSNGFAKAAKSYYAGNGGHSRTDFFAGFNSVRVEAESTLGFVADNSGKGETTFDRSIKLADIPFTGAGDVFVRNDIADTMPFAVTLVNGANTCSGTIGVANAAAAYETTLLFADGANWAGTVVADGHVALTNLTDAAAPATVTFGTLDIPKGKTFDIRLWKNGDTVVSDMVNLAVGAVGGGTLNVVPQAGADIAPKDRFVLGTAPAGAWAGVTVRLGGRRYRIEETEVEGQHVVICTARLDTGLMFTIH